MAESHFQCKQFFIRQRKDVFPITTDSILLGSWIQANTPNYALDMGCGTGIISLMLAQRYPFLKKIVAIDISEEAIKCADENFVNSSWSEKLRAQCISWNQFSSNEQFDLIVCNPPYFIHSLPSVNPQKSLHRHASEQDFDNLAGVVRNTISDTGIFGVVLPAEQEPMISFYLNQKGLVLKRIAKIFNSVEANVSLVLLEFCTTSQKLIHEDIILFDPSGMKTDSYYNLTKDFYLEDTRLLF